MKVHECSHLRSLSADRVLRRYSVPERWLVHAYYTVSPYAPDGSGRILLAGADLERGVSEILVLSQDGEVLERFGEHAIEGPTFFHTGRWQTWGVDACHVYYSSGTMTGPQFVQRELATGREVRVDGAMDGAAAEDGALVSGLLGLLELAKYPARKHTKVHPIGFQEREAHGLFRYSVDPPSAALALSVEDILQDHPDRTRLTDWDRRVADTLGPGEGLTLLAFCVRWSPDGSRLLFFLGNNGVPSERGEPRVKYVMTATRDLQDLNVAIDLGFEGRGVHWGWQPDNEYLIGYGPDPVVPDRLCLAEVRYDGTGYRKVADHGSGGHPSISPTDPDLIVTDHYPPEGQVCFLSRKQGMLESIRLSLHHEGHPVGRSQHRVDAHPVFHPSGDRVLCNTLAGPLGELVEIKVPSQSVGMEE